MASFQYLQLAGILLSYFLKVGVAYVVCLCLSRILTRPDLRFRVWLGLVLASGLYWASLLVAAIGHLFPQAVAASGHLAAPGVVATPNHWLVPRSWGYDVALVGRTVLRLYLGIMFLLACSKAWNHLRLRRLFKLGVPASSEVTALFDEMCRQYGLPRCKLAVLPGLTSPATAYWWTPRIVLPEEIAVQGATPHLVNVFCHEMAHILRRDYFWSNITDLICGLLFFHPAIWQARNHMRLERELACDLAVVNARPDFRIDYADNLARSVRRRMIEGGTSCGVDFAASASFLSVRIRNILTEPPRMPWWKKLSSATASLALLISFLIVSPALSVAIDFASDVPAAAGVKTQPLARPVRSVRSPGAAGAHPLAAPATKAGHQERGQKAPDYGGRGEDSLRHVRSRSYLPETPAYRMASGTFVADQSASPNWDAPALNERSPATPRVAAPSVTSIVLSTIGQVIIRERTEHRVPGRAHEGKMMPSSGSVE